MTSRTPQKPGRNSGLLPPGKGRSPARAGRPLGPLLAALTLAGALSAPALAEEAPAEILAATCGACHGPGGESPGEIPSINELEAEAMEALLLAYKSGELEGTVMNRIARGYTDSEIAALVTYFTAQP